MILLKLFLTFFKIGAFTFGGGYAMLPFIQEEVLANQWLSASDLVDFIAVSESTPGPFAINIATYVGSHLGTAQFGSVIGGLIGSFCSTLGVVLPSFIIILIVARFFERFKNSKTVKGCMSGLRPAVIGMIASAVVSVGHTALFPDGFSVSALSSYAFICSIIIALITAVLVFKVKLHPIAVILISAVLGIASGYLGLTPSAMAATPSPTATATVMPTASVIPTASATPTVSATPSASATPSVTVSPSPTASATPKPIDVETSVDFDIIMLKHRYTVGDNMVLELYSMDDELLATDTQWVDGSTERLSIHFEVPEYQLGRAFKLRTAGGINYIKYYEKYGGVGGNSITFSTYGYFDENNNYVKENKFIIECDPKHEKAVNVYMPDGSPQSGPRARLIDGVTMIPVRAVAEKLGLDVTYYEKHSSVSCSVGKEEIIFNIGDTNVTACGTDITAPHKICRIDGSVFVPLRTLTDSVGSAVEVYDHGDYLDVLIGQSGLVNKVHKAEIVNGRGLSSDTDYLVWISKHEFKTRVYTGSRYNWKLVKEFPCAIGAPGSETITGTFKYQYRMPSWDYGTYYVGPCLVFYGNYAMHSTLLYYGGGEYDGRVGVKISHGCVRMHPQDINWLDSYLPRNSTVYITE